MKCALPMSGAALFLSGSMRLKILTFAGLKYPGRLMELNKMGIEKATTYVCDRCGARSDKGDFSGGGECGSVTVTVNGSRGGMAYDGAWGGYNIAEKLLLCFNCSDQLMEHLKPKKEGKDDG